MGSLSDKQVPFFRRYSLLGYAYMWWPLNRSWSNCTSFCRANVISCHVTTLFLLLCSVSQEGGHGQQLIVTIVAVLNGSVVCMLTIIAVTIEFVLCIRSMINICSARGNWFICDNWSATHHPFETVQAAHLRGSVNRCHSVACSNVQRSACFQHEELEHLQVSLLCCQVYGRHIVVHLSICAAMQEMIKSIYLLLINQKDIIKETSLDLLIGFCRGHIKYLVGGI